MAMRAKPSQRISVGDHMKGKPLREYGAVCSSVVAACSSSGAVQGEKALELLRQRHFECMALGGHGTRASRVKVDTP
jgi:hypothetical protein